MANGVDSSRAVRFFDDRGKVAGYEYLQEVYFTDDAVCLCRTDSYRHVLFCKVTGEVLTSNMEFWIAENFTRLPGKV